VGLRGRRAPAKNGRCESASIRAMRISKRRDVGGIVLVPCRRSGKAHFANAKYQQFRSIQARIYSLDQSLAGVGFQFIPDSSQNIRMN
jgi:hypothetical protein